MNIYKKNKFYLSQQTLGCGATSLSQRLMCKTNFFKQSARMFMDCRSMKSKEKQTLIKQSSAFALSELHSCANYLHLFTY